MGYGWGDVVIFGSHGFAGEKREMSTASSQPGAQGKPEADGGRFAGVGRSTPCKL